MCEPCSSSGGLNLDHVGGDGGAVGGWCRPRDGHSAGRRVNSRGRGRHLARGLGRQDARDGGELSPAPAVLRADLELVGKALCDSSCYREASASIIGGLANECYPGVYGASLIPVHVVGEYGGTSVIGSNRLCTPGQLDLGVGC